MRTMQPAVSVGVPVYNGARFLQDCLECLRSQTFSDIEVLIFDNASTDGTEAIARDFVARDPRFSYFRQSANKGPVRISPMFCRRPSARTFSGAPRTICRT